MPNIAPFKQPPANDMLAGIRVIDADTHVTEPYDLWTSRAPSKFRDRVPQIKQVDGRPLWVIEGDRPMGINHASSTIHHSGEKAVGVEFLGMQLKDVHPACHDVRARLALMDEMGIWAQIAYPNVLGFSGQRAYHIDPELRLICAQIYNDAMMEMQAASNNRIFPMALVPWWDPKLAVAEIERCAAMGMRGVNTNPDPHGLGLPPLGDPHWDPIWETCSGLDLPVNFHIGASDETMSWFGTASWPSFSDNQRLAMGSTMLITSNMRVIGNIIVSGFLDRFPTLKIVSVESGVGWLPFLLESLEYQLREAGVPMVSSPREIFSRQIYACSWFERWKVVDDARALGIDNILWETDFPHPTCLYPNALDHMEPALKRMTEQERVKIFGGNAARIYNIPLD